MQKFQRGQKNAFYQNRIGLICSFLIQIDRQAYKHTEKQMESRQKCRQRNRIYIINYMARSKAWCAAINMIYMDKVISF